MKSQNSKDTSIGKKAPDGNYTSGDGRPSEGHFGKDLLLGIVVSPKQPFNRRLEHPRKKSRF